MSLWVWQQKGKVFLGGENQGRISFKSNLGLVSNFLVPAVVLLKLMFTPVVISALWDAHQFVSFSTSETLWRQLNWATFKELTKPYIIEQYTNHIFWMQVFLYLVLVRNTTYVFDQIFTSFTLSIQRDWGRQTYPD